SFYNQLAVSVVGCDSLSPGGLSSVVGFSCVSLVGFSVCVFGVSDLASLAREVDGLEDFLELLELGRDFSAFLAISSSYCFIISLILSFPSSSSNFSSFFCKSKIVR